MTGAELIAAERQRQISQEGWSEAHDDQHGCKELVLAAMAYIAKCTSGHHAIEPESFWPWEGKWFKPTNSIRDLTKAGALIAAEIDRLQRQRVEYLNDTEQP